MTYTTADGKTKVTQPDGADKDRRERGK
jgi:hypothetical protein